MVKFHWRKLILECSQGCCVKIWPGDLDNQIGFQILLRTKYVSSLEWILILECSQGCYGRTVALLYPFATLFGKGIIKQQWTIEEISIFSNSSHLEWRVGLSDTILKGTHPCQVWFNLVQGFQRRRFKCESLWRTTSDGKSSHGFWPGELKKKKKSIMQNYIWSSYYLWYIVISPFSLFLLKFNGDTSYRSSLDTLH